MDDRSPVGDGGSRIDIYWIPLGAGGRGFVRWNGRLYEWLKARGEHRSSLDLYHTALEVHLPEGRFIIENAWPSPDADVESRGVTVQGPVGTRRMMRFRGFRYEVRCWRDGIIPDAIDAVDSPRLLSTDPIRARSLLGQVAAVPPLTWGRDPSGVGEMWNSNSVVSWLLTRIGVPTDELRPPAGGRVPGWVAGIVVAQR